MEATMSADNPASAIPDNTDPILAVIDERIAAIEAATPQDLTRITANDPPLGFESLVAASMAGDVGPTEPPIDVRYPGQYRDRRGAGR
jgi:hypothetical protein